MSQQPARCPHTTYELDSPGWRTEARVRRDERTSFTAAEARSARRGTGSRRQRKAPPPSQGARCDEPTKGTNHRAAGLSSSAGGLLLAPSDAIGHYSLSTVKSLKNLRRRA